MRNVLFCSILFFVFGYQQSYGQCDFITPPAVKKINYASREVTFSNVTMNGKATTYLAVKKGATVKIKTNVSSRKEGSYCPNCIVQIYWGIRGHTSVCAKSFHGYQFNKKTSTLKFKAPMKDGIYYITMGATLDYSCKNNIYRPNCSSDDAFAVLKVGNPDPEKKITLVKEEKGSQTFMKATLVKSGCFGDLDKTEWFFEGKKLAFDNQKEIPLTAFGTYKIVWSNCLESVTDSLNHNETATVSTGTVSGTMTSTTNANDKNIISPTVGYSDTSEETDIAVLIENNDRFVLQNLIFDLGKSAIRPEAKIDLNKLAQIMKDQPSMKILLEGHTDKRGNTRQNHLLSIKRVQATKKYLIKHGVMKSNIETKGWGDQKPLIITKDIEKGKINRRVEIRILSR